MKRLATLFCLAVATSNCAAQEARIPVDITRPAENFQLIGELGLELGEMATVEGTVVEGPFKGYAGGPNLVVKVINGRATQHWIQIPISPYFGDFGEAHSSVPVIENGSSYRLRAYETGAFVGVPADAYREARIMMSTPGFYFQTSLIVLSGDKIAPININWTPSQFLDRDALLSGVAKNEDEVATIQAAGWKLILTDVDKWTDAQTGKQAEVFGTVRATESKDTFRVEHCRSRLTQLEDQLGTNVALRGTAHKRDGLWSFNYRGTDLYVEGMEKLPDWTFRNDGRPMEITGILERAELPKSDQISVKANRDLGTHYVVRRPKWTAVNELLTPELPPEE